MKNIKVAFVLRKAHVAGTKNLVMEYIRHMDYSKVHIDFICDNDSAAAPIEEIKQLGGKFFFVSPASKPLANVSDLTKIFKQEKYDVVHAWNSAANILPMIAAKRAGVPVRISESLSMGNKGEWKTYVKMALRPFAKVAATHFLACGKDCGIYLFGKKLYNEGKVEVFKTVINAKANNYNPTLREQTRHKQGWDNKVVYGFIGRYAPQKNPIFMIDIFNEIQKRQSNAQLMMIGWGKLEKDMMSHIKELGIEDKVLNIGTTEDIKQYYNAMDAFLLPSLYEGLPVVGLEAQACGLPIFFSTEIDPEAAVCELGVFIPLSDKAEVWAEKIIPIVTKNMKIRKSRSEDVIKAGNDSEAETERLMRYYANAVKTVNKLS